MCMYINESVKLRDDLPKRLQRDFAELQEYYDAGDWLNYDLLLEVFEANVKAHYIAGKISMEDLDRIFERYCIPH